MKRMFLWAVAAFSIAALMLGATAALAADTACTGPMGAVTINGNVSAGAGCDLTSTTVNGTVKVNPGGSLFIRVAFGGATIKGSIQSKGATSINIERATIGGNVAIEGTTGSTTVAGVVKGNVEVQASAAVQIRATVGRNITVHDNTSAASSQESLVSVLASSVEGNVDIHDNSLFASNSNLVVAAFNTIGGNLLVNNNEAGGAPPTGNVINVTANSVGKSLQCANNSPPPTASNGLNAAKQKQGQCAGL